MRTALRECSMACLQSFRERNLTTKEIECYQTCLGNLQALWLEWRGD
jgi:hypothetical protein